MGPPIFVIGTPRSGTTLTAKILGRHSKIFMPGETHFFEDVYSRRKELGEHFGTNTSEKILERLSTIYGRSNEPADQKRVSHLFSDHENVASLVASWKTYKDVITSFMELQMRHEGKSRWGNQVPRDIFNYKDILEFFPDVKIIVCVRDVRDFLLSYKNKWKITSPDNVESLRKLYHPVVTSLLWKSSMRLIPVLKKRVNPDNLLILYYEELASRPEITVKKICWFIDEDFEPGMLNVDNPNSSHKVMQNGIFATSVNRWKEELPPEDAFLSQIIVKKELESHGYKIENIKINYFHLIKKILSFPYVLIRGINSRRGSRGPLLPYLARRAGALIFKAE